MWQVIGKTLIVGIVALVLFEALWIIFGVIPTQDDPFKGFSNLAGVFYGAPLAMFVAMLYFLVEAVRYIWR